ncbi:MAG: DUF1189 domain-containing protein [Lachnospiraceae bacterium]|jgi:hypothetical protein|nr:DUF1189 domain-containing protein [Lachnospiraceae bacterium]
MNVFGEMIAAVGRIKAYPGFLRNRKGKVFGYGVLLILVYFLLSSIIPYVGFIASTGGWAKILRENVPAFTLSDGKLWVEEPISGDDGINYIDIDTQNGDFSEADLKEYYRYNSVLLMDADKVVAKGNGQVMTLEWKTIGDVRFDHEALVGFSPYINLAICILGFFWFWWDVAWFFFGVLFLSLFGQIVNSACKSRLTFGQVYLLTLYARTTPLLIKGILGLIGIAVPFYFLLNAGATIIYLILACRLIAAGPEGVEPGGLAGPSEPEDGGYTFL